MVSARPAWKQAALHQPCDLQVPQLTLATLALVAPVFNQLGQTQ